MNDTYYYYFTEQRPDVAVIELKEKVLGGNDALEFAVKLDEIIRAAAKTVIIDLKNVEIMNSSGLGMLVSTLSTLKKHDMKMMLASVPQKIDSLLKMTHLNQVFVCCDSVASAEAKCV